MFHHTNRPSYRYKKPEAQNGDLRTPLTFYTSKVEEGLHGRDVSHEKAFLRWAKFTPLALKT